MGYTTTFNGSISIEPPLDFMQTETVNDFCDQRHGGDIGHAGFPSFWCDYRVSADGSKISWNGSEKSYEMDEWLRVLIERFFSPWGRKLNGAMLARGENSDDIWKLTVVDNRVSRQDAKISFSISDVELKWEEP